MRLLLSCSETEAGTQASGSYMLTNSLRQSLVLLLGATMGNVTYLLTLVPKLLSSKSHLQKGVLA
jgi:hypothetical protein